MTWNKFLIILLTVYAVYYIVNMMLDMLRSAKTEGANENILVMEEDRTAVSADDIGKDSAEHFREVIQDSPREVEGSKIETNGLGKEQVKAVYAEKEELEDDVHWLTVPDKEEINAAPFTSGTVSMAELKKQAGMVNSGVKATIKTAF